MRDTEEQIQMKKTLNRSDILRTVKNVLLVVLGTVILAFGTSVFLLPFDLVTGGVAGYAIVIKSILPFDFITKELVIAVLTWVLFFLGFIVLGKDFAAKSLISTIVYPIATALFSGLRSRINEKIVPAPFRGLGATLIAASFISLAFMGFAGIVEKIFA